MLLLELVQKWANYGPEAKSGPLNHLICPAKLEKIVRIVLNNVILVSHH